MICLDQRKILFEKDLRRSALHLHFQQVFFHLINTTSKIAKTDMNPKLPIQSSEIYAEKNSRTGRNKPIVAPNTIIFSFKSFFSIFLTHCPIQLFENDD